MLTTPKFKGLLIVGFLTTITLLSGCTVLSSQTLDLHPELEVSRKLDKNIRIDVQPVDIRLNKVIGLRVTGKEPQPEIVLKDSKALLQHTTEHAFEDMGIRRFFSGDFTMVIKLVALDYKATKTGLKQVIDLNMKISVDLSKDNKRYTGSYISNKQHTFLGTPSEKENEKVIGDLVAENMNLVVNDPQLLDFIQFN